MAVAYGMGLTLHGLAVLLPRLRSDDVRRFAPRRTTDLLPRPARTHGIDSWSLPCIANVHDRGVIGEYRCLYRGLVGPCLRIYLISVVSMEKQI